MGKPNRRANRAQRNRTNHKSFLRRPSASRPSPAPLIAAAASAEPSSAPRPPDPIAVPSVTVREDPLAPWSRLGPLPWLNGNDLLHLYCRLSNWHAEHAVAELEDFVWASLAEDLGEDEHAWLVTDQHLEHWMLAANLRHPFGGPSVLERLADEARGEGQAQVASALVAMDRAVSARFEVVGLPAPGWVSVRHLHREGASQTTAVVALPFTYGRVPLGAGLVGQVWPGEAGGLRFAAELLVFPTPPDLALVGPEADGAAWLQLWYLRGCRGPEYERRHPPAPVIGDRPQAWLLN